MQPKISVTTDSVLSERCSTRAQGCPQQTSARPDTLTKLARSLLIKLSLLLVLCSRVPTAHAGNFYYCQSGWYLSGSDCYAYYGGYTSLYSVSTGYYGMKGSAS